MATGSATRPVHRVQFSTSDEAEAEEFIRKTYVGNRMRFTAVSDDTHHTTTVAQAGEIVASQVRSTIDYCVACDPFSYFLFFVLDHGRVRIENGGDETVVLDGQAAFFPLGVELDNDVFDVDLRAVQLPATRLEAVAEETAGIAPADLRFEAVTPVSPGMARHWSAFVGLACDMLLAENSPAVYPLLAEELTRTAAMTALHTFPNTALTMAYQRDPGWVEPAVVRRATAFIQAHADQPITLGQIAAAAGVTGRALQYAFRRHYDTTPTGYLRRVRLERAEQELRAAGPGGGVTVAGVARRWGWASPSQFTVAYQQQFGTRPSHTLRNC